MSKSKYLITTNEISIVSGIPYHTANRIEKGHTKDSEQEPLFLCTMYKLQKLKGMNAHDIAVKIWQDGKLAVWAKALSSSLNIAECVAKDLVDFIASIQDVQSLYIMQLQKNEYVLRLYFSVGDNHCIYRHWDSQETLIVNHAKYTNTQGLEFADILKSVV